MYSGLHEQPVRTRASALAPSAHANHEQWPSGLLLQSRFLLDVGSPLYWQSHLVGDSHVSDFLQNCSSINWESLLSTHPGRWFLKSGSCMKTSESSETGVYIDESEGVTLDRGKPRGKSSNINTPTLVSWYQKETVTDNLHGTKVRPGDKPDMKCQSSDTCHTVQEGLNGTLSSARKTCSTTRRRFQGSDERNTPKRDISEQPYSCDLCGNFYRLRATLLRHMSRSHPRHSDTLSSARVNYDVTGKRSQGDDERSALKSDVRQQQYTWDLYNKIIPPPNSHTVTSQGS